MKALPRLLILGAGGFGREVLAWARMHPDCGRRWQVAGFLDDNLEALGAIDPGVSVLARIKDYAPAKDDRFVCAIGTAPIRARVHRLIADRGGTFLTLVHPTAVVAERAVLGQGVVVCPYAIVSVDSRIGDGSAIYYHASIDHDAMLGFCCQISAHCDVTGGAQLGDRVFLGSHATVLPFVRVGDDAVVGAGAVVRENVAAGPTVVGCPARPVGK